MSNHLPENKKFESMVVLRGSIGHVTGSTPKALEALAAALTGQMELDVANSRGDYVRIAAKGPELRVSWALVEELLVEASSSPSGGWN